MGHPIRFEKVQGWVRRLIIVGQELRGLFEPYGTVMECDVINDKNFGFVHIDARIGKLGWDGGT